MIAVAVKLALLAGMTLEFQFGTDWACCSRYVGDVFGALLAIEGLMAFFLESTFIGLFCFGWDRLSKTQHLLVTTLMAIGTKLSALWILIASGWMQNPVGAEFSHQTMRVIGTAGATLFPFVMRSSTQPDASLTVWDSVSSHLTLGLMSRATVLFMPLVVFYTSWAYRVMRGKVTAAQVRANEHTAY